MIERSTAGCNNTTWTTAMRTCRPQAAAPGRHRRADVAAAAAAEVPARFAPDDWRRKARPIRPGGTYPAKEHCSNCGLCDTYYVAHVKEACAFLGEGMSRIDALEEQASTGWPAAGGGCCGTLDAARLALLHVGWHVVCRFIQMGDTAVAPHPPGHLNRRLSS